MSISGFDPNVWTGGVLQGESLSAGDVGSCTDVSDLSVERFTMLLAIMDKLIELSNDVTKLQRRVSRAVRHADLEVTSQLRSLDNRLLYQRPKVLTRQGDSLRHRYVNRCCLH